VVTIPDTPSAEGFRVKSSIRQQLAHRKRRLERRLDKTDVRGCSQPMFTARTLHYEIAERIRGLASGGIGAIHLLARRLGLIDAIDRHLHLLKIHLPYHESDHVLNLAYNALCEGTCLQDLELRRHDEVFLDALGARRIPDPTTAGSRGPAAQSVQESVEQPTPVVPTRFARQAPNNSRMLGALPS
jgi:hypothetical protein